MTSWEEARALGGIGRLGVELLYETVDAVRRFSGFPPPPGHERWDEAAVTAIAHDFVGGADRVGVLLLRAADDDSFERLLQASVRNFLRSEYRKTDAGRMMRSLRRIVENDDAVVTIPPGQAGAGCWALPAYASSPPFGGRTSDLVGAAFAVEVVRMARWRPDARNRPPVAESESLRRVVVAVLEAAGAPVTPSTVLQVVAHRFPSVDPAVSVPLPEGEETGALHASGDVAAARLLAEDVWDQLNENERLVAGILDEPVRDVVALTGLSRGSAHRAMLGAKSVLVDYLTDMSEPHAVVGALRSMSDLLREVGTQRAELASNHGEEH